MSLSGSRASFDGAVEMHPSLHSHLGVCLNLVENVSFESAVRKVKIGEEHTLAATERIAVQNLLLRVDFDNTARANSDKLFIVERLLNAPS